MLDATVKKYRDAASQDERRSIIKQRYNETSPKEDLPLHDRVLFHLSFLREYAQRLSALANRARANPSVWLKNDQFYCLEVSVECLNNIFVAGANCLEKELVDSWHALSELIGKLRTGKVSDEEIKSDLSLVYLSTLIMTGCLKGHLVEEDEAVAQHVERSFIVDLHSPLFKVGQSSKDQLEQLTANLRRGLSAG